MTLRAFVLMNRPVGGVVMQVKPPIIQLALDYPTIEEALAMAAIGHPLISGKDPLGALTDFVKRVRAAYRPRTH